MIIAQIIATLFLITVLLFGSLRLLFRSTESTPLVLVVVILYFWTFLGAWFYVFDGISGFKGFNIGLTYYYMMEKLFPFRLNEQYLLSIVAYGIFSFSVIIPLWIWRKGLRQVNGGDKVLVSHFVILAVMVIGILISTAAARDAIRMGMAGTMSFYEAKLLLVGTNAKLFAVANESIAMALFLGLSILVCQNDERASILGISSNRWIFIGYGLLGVTVLLYLTIVGDRHALFAGLLWAVIYQFGVLQKQSFKRLSWMVVICLLVLLPGSNLRYMVFSSTPVQKDLPKGPIAVDGYEHVPRKLNTVAYKLGSSLLSNEMFAAHFSLFGCLEQNVEPNRGVALRYFADRISSTSGKTPVTTYDYYVGSVNATQGQGYTIHHATGWYLNLGWIGVVIGGALLGLFIVLLYNIPKWLSFSMPLKVLATTLPISFASYLPSLVRSGPEAYKAMLVEGIGIPTLILVASMIPVVWLELRKQ